MGFLSRRGPRARAYRCFFATDIHGSDRCFRKFLAAAAVYEVDVLLLGGDIAGKAIVPVERCANGKLRFSFLGENQEADGSEEEAVCERIRFNGMYPWVATGDEIAAMAGDAGLRDRLFEEAISEQVAMWCDLAAERLPSEKRIIITPGNDDPLFVDDILDASTRIEAPERRMVEMGPVWLASLGNTTQTPWHTPREFSEEELRAQIREMVTPYADGRPVVFNFHCPPMESGLDVVAKLDSDFRPVVVRGTPVTTSGGSAAVRDAIVEYSPVVALHGHIHEARGATRLGQSWCINPGSDYSSGILKGAIVDFDTEGGYKAHLLTQG